MRCAWPKHLLLELTNACDLRCRHCHFHGEGVVRQRRTGHMEARVWRAALREIEDWDAEITVQPWGMGEPLLHPDLWAVVRTARSRPRTAVGFYSNGMQWSADDVAAAVDTGLDWVCISMDGLDREQFAHYRAGADLDRVVATVEALAAARARRGSRTPELRLNMVLYEDLRTGSEQFLERWRGVVDRVTLSRFRPVGSRRFSPVELARVPCYQLETILPVAWDGGVAICCEDPQAAHLVGRFPERSLAELWHGPRMQELRRAHRAGEYDQGPLCGDCDAWTGIYGRDGRAPGAIVRETTAATIHDFVPQPARDAVPR